MLKDLARVAKGSNIWAGLQLFIWTFYKRQQKSTCLLTGIPWRVLKQSNKESLIEN